MSPNPSRHPMLDELAGILSDENAVNQRLRAASEKAILLSPATVCHLQPGCAVSFTVVWVNPATECYPVGGGKVALGRVALLRIASAAAIAWDPVQSGRVDDRRHPYVVEYRAVGAWSSLDGSTIPLVENSQLDLRDGSAAAEKVFAEARDKNEAPATLRSMRAKILERVQSGAQLRAIRAGMGIGSYTAKELQEKPFVVVRAVFSGHDADPEMERENKRAIRAKMLGGAMAMWGAPVQLPPAPPPPALGPSVPDAEWEESGTGSAPAVKVPPPPAPPPPVAPTGPMGPTAETSKPSYGGPSGPGGAPAAARAPATNSAAPRAPANASAPGPTGQSGWTIPGGRNQGQPIEFASQNDLEFWTNRVRGNLEKGTARNPEREQRFYDALCAEMERRAKPYEPPSDEDLDEVHGDDEIPF